MPISNYIHRRNAHSTHQKKKQDSSVRVAFRCRYFHFFSRRVNCAHSEYTCYTAATHETMRMQRTIGERRREVNYVFGQEEWANCSSYIYVFVTDNTKNYVNFGWLLACVEMETCWNEMPNKLFYVPWIWHLRGDSMWMDSMNFDQLANFEFYEWFWTFDGEWKKRCWLMPSANWFLRWSVRCPLINYADRSIRFLQTACDCQRSKLSENWFAFIFYIGNSNLWNQQIPTEIRLWLIVMDLILIFLDFAELNSTHIAYKPHISLYA